MFKENKYTKWYYSIINNAKKQIRKKKNGVYYESHHIIPESMGGIEKVLLTAKEHFICHLLLPKMLEGTNKHKMINALIRMMYSKSKGQYRYNSKSYEVIRAFIAEKNSALFKGKQKSLETRKRMSEGRKGIIFSESHLNNIKLANQKSAELRKGKPGHIPTEETRLLWSQQRKGKNVGNTVAKGRIWINNGTVSKMIYPTDIIPDGYKLGRIKNARKKKSPT